MKVKDLNTDHVGCYIYIDEVGHGLIERIKNLLVQKTIEGELDGAWRDRGQWYVSFVDGPQSVPVSDNDRVSIPHDFVSGVRH